MPNRASSRAIRLFALALAAALPGAGLAATACAAPSPPPEEPRRMAGEPEVPARVEELAERRSAGPAAAAESTPQPLAVDRVEVHHLTSRVTAAPYELRVSLPHGYEDASRRFPVVYLLDADYSFLLARNITDHLSERGHLDEVVVVGIGYRD